MTAIAPAITHVFASPVGAIFVSGDGERLTALRIAPDVQPGRSEGDALLKEAESQISAYFAGRLTDFDLPLAPASTPRGAEIRAGMRAIPFGETASYGELARRLDSGPRAIGQACRRNPLPILVPCHRVIGAGGAIGHYSGGDGIATKAALLNLEDTQGGARWAA